MGAYITALIQQITAPDVNKLSTDSLSNNLDDTSLIRSNSNNKDSNNIRNDGQNNDLLTAEHDDLSQSEMNYNSPSPSESSLSVLSRHNDTENDNESENGQKNLIPIKEEDESKENENEFINHGKLHFQKIRDEWTKSSINNDGNENENENNKMWEPMVIDDEEQEIIYKCIADEKSFPYNIPLEIMTEIMNKIWKQEQIMGYEISSKHADHGLALDRL